MSRIMINDLECRIVKKQTYDSDTNSYKAIVVIKREESKHLIREISRPAYSGSEWRFTGRSKEIL